MNLAAIALSLSTFGSVGVILPNPHDHTYSADSVFGVNTLTVDPTTGRGYLDIPLFAGYSYTQMNTELATNPLLSGFQRGMDEDFFSLANSAGFWPGISDDSFYDTNGVISPTGYIIHSQLPIDGLMFSMGWTNSNYPQLLSRMFVACYDEDLDRHMRLFLSDVADLQPELYDPELFSNPDWLDDYTSPDGLVLDFVERWWDLGDNVQSLQTGHLLWTQVAEPEVPEPISAMVWSALVLLLGIYLYQRTSR